MLKQACREYAAVKELVSKAEDLDNRAGANIQINKEFRDALSHLFRVISDALQDGDIYKTDRDYYYTNIDKARGHLYRAGYDAMDGISISLHDSLVELTEIPLDIKTQTISDFIKKVDSISKFHKSLGDLKNAKDVGRSAAEDFRKCIKKLNNLTTITSEISAAIPQMRKLQSARKWQNRRYGYIFPVILAVIMLIAGYFLNPMLTKLFPPTP